MEDEFGREALRDVFEGIESAYEYGNREFISTQYLDLNKLINGFWTKSSWALGGNPKMGKSTLLLNFADNLRFQNKIPYIFSLEMTKKEWLIKRLSKAGRIDSRKLRTGDLKKSIRGNYWPELSRACSEVYDNLYPIEDNPSLTLNEIITKVKYAKEKHNIGFVGIDYIQRMDVPGKTVKQREKELLKVAESLKTLARDLDIIIMFTSQLDEEVAKRKDKKPILSDLNGLERAVDVALLLYRPELYWPDNPEKKGWAELNVYSRFDPPGTAKLAAKMEYSLFENLPSEDKRRIP